MIVTYEIIMRYITSGNTSSWRKKERSERRYLKIITGGAKKVYTF
jgi:hypothetical protein